MLSFETILKKIEDSAKEISFTAEPQSLYDPIRYTLEVGGKRLRPTLLMMANNIYKEDIDSAIPTALGIEMFHNFTLLHDDLMDDADKRRNKPTVHKVWNANTAILSGDAMLIASYQLIGKTESSKLGTILDIFTHTALEICEGQQYDMEFESRNDVSEEEYMEMIRLKTAVLLGASLKIGALLGNASDEDASKLYDAGIKVGLAFQLQDDLLDVYGDPKTFGKNIGGDITSNKKTFFLINAISQSSPEQKKILKSWIEQTHIVPEEKIKAITNIYNELHLKEQAENNIKTLFDEGIEYINNIEVPEERKEILIDFLHKLLKRDV